MSDIEGKAFRRLKLRVGVRRYLSKRAGSHYLGQVRSNFYWASDEEFDGVTAEMMAEGVLAKTTGRDGGVKLLIAKQEEQQNG
jgi:hypothetical protein